MWVHDRKPPPTWTPDPTSRYAAGLRGAWLLNDGGGTRAIDATGRNHGTWSSVVAGSSWQTGRFHGAAAAAFATNSNYIDTGVLPRANGAFSVVAWLRMGTGDSYRNLLGASGGGNYYLLLFTANGTQFSLWSNGDGHAGAAIGYNVWTNNEWCQFAFVRAGDSVTGGLRLYRNGVMLGSLNSSTLSSPPTANWWIGSRSDGAGQYLDGSVDHLFYWERALSDADVADLYARPFAPFRAPQRRPWVLIGEPVAATYAATAALSAGPATLAASATFAPPVYSATAALAAGHATLAAAAKHIRPTYSAKAALAAGHATLAASATFTAPVYSGTAAVSAGPVALSASATFAPPVYSGTAALSAGHATLAASATFAMPTYTGAAAAVVGAATLSASATFAAPVYSGTAAVSAGPASAAAAATHTSPAYVATVAAAQGPATLAASATFTAPVYSGTAAAAQGPATLAASATFTPPVYSAALAAAAGPATLAAAAAFTAPVYSGTAALTAGPASSTGTAAVTAPVYSGTAAVSSGPATAAAAATFAPPVYSATAALAAGHAALAASVTFTAPVYAGTAAVSSGPATAAAAAAYALIFRATAALYAPAAAAAAAVEVSVVYTVPGRLAFALRPGERLYPIPRGTWIACDLRITGLACTKSGALTYLRRGEAAPRDTTAAAGAVVRGPIRGVLWATTTAHVQAVVVDTKRAKVEEGEACA